MAGLVDRARPRRNEAARVGTPGGVRRLLDLRTAQPSIRLVTTASSPEAGKHMSFEANPPRDLWGTVTIEELVDGKAVSRKIPVPFEQVEVDAILEAKRIADEFIAHGEHGTDNISRSFWGDVYGAGLIEADLFPIDEASWQNRPDTIYNLGLVKNAAQRARVSYQSVIDTYPYAENLQKFRDRSQMMQNIEDQLGRMKLHEDQQSVV